jgi:phosphoribosylglycinamide formyltransferase-1
MMHLVTPELDRGPAVTFCRFPIRGGVFDPLLEAFKEKKKQKGLKAIQEEEGEREPLFSLIRQEGVKRELPLIVYTIKAFAEGEVKLKNFVLCDAQDRPLPGPYDLSQKIERHLATGEW